MPQLYFKQSAHTPVSIKIEMEAVQGGGRYPMVGGSAVPIK